MDDQRLLPCPTCGRSGELPPPATIGTAPACLNINDKAMWVTGWNECRDAIAASLAGASND